MWKLILFLFKTYKEVFKNQCNFQLFYFLSLIRNMTEIFKLFEM